MEVTVSVLLGLLTAAAAFLAAFLGARQARSDRAQRERAAQREEWFRRLQWAAELTLQHDEATRAAGFNVFDVLDASDLANNDDRAILRALNNKNEALESLQAAYSAELDDTIFVTDDRDDNGGTP